MTPPVRPETTDVSGLHRILSPDEFHQAQQLSPEALASNPFPVLPPTAPKDATARLDPNIAPGASAAGQPTPGVPLKGLARILTQHIAQPIMDHPLMTAAMVAGSALPGVGPAIEYGFMGSMGKDILEYSAQKAAELSLPKDEKAQAEADPERISGEDAAVSAGLLGVAPLVKGAVRAAGAAGDAADAVATKVAPEMTAQIKAHAADISDAFKKIFAPENRSPEAKATADIIRATTGAQAASYEQAAFKLDGFRRAIEPLPEADKLGFIDAIEGGKSQASPEFQEAADTMRELLDGARTQVQNLGTGKLSSFIENYFPHIWTDPERATDAFKEGAEGTSDAPVSPAGTAEGSPEALAAAKINAGGKRPMAGSGAFLKQRTIPTTAEGMAMGLELVSTNPVDLTLLKLREMQRYVMAHQSLNELKDNNLVQYVRAGEKPPEGYQRIDDRIATVFGPREGAVTLPEGATVPNENAPPTDRPMQPSDVGVTGTRIMGQYYAPETVSTVVNNYLSPGLRGNAIYDAYRGLGNSLNQAQLGLSAFHLMFTSMDASVSRAALGLEHIASGSPLEGLKDIVSSPVAPVTNMIQGAKIRNAYLNPEGARPEMAALANAVKEAGGRVRQDSFYKTSAPEKMIDAWKAGEYGKAAALSLPALFETAAKPIMDYVVPMQKLGVFGDLAKKALADLPDDATLADRRSALSSAWDSVDNRMGQLVYDNLFWNKTFKDLAMSSVRSVGWNIGTIRELGGGLTDLAGMAKDAVTPGESVGLTHKAAYVISLPLVTGMYGALYQYLRTGSGPSETKDYFFPKTGEQDADGNDERVQIASYMKDFFAYAGHPLATVEHKVSPLLNSVFEMMSNKDYYGDEIRNPDDPAVKQIGQEAAFMAKQAVPFSLSNLSETNRRGDNSAATKFGNWFGITPAPREKVRSPAQNEIADIMAKQGHDMATPEEADARQSRAEILSGLRGNNSVDLQQAVSDAIERHQITSPEIGQLLKRAGTTPMQEKFKTLSTEQALDVFKKSSPREQAVFAEALLGKISRATSRGAPTMGAQ